ncbi:DUF6600 domain-containing protein [Dechloromonas sp. ARDL1]|uniref:DUF6600 domain-containing protein n=1 Tax=Dechloromonas sp. ARDL1 TaxID=3322121 RepID=UPI003DA6E64E
MLQSLRRLFLAILLLIAWPALAQLDPPGRVGRLSYLEGDVGFKVDRKEQGGAATLNWPVSSGAVLDSGRNGRAEVWIGSTAYRLSRDSEVEFPVVDDHRVDVRLSGGTLAVTVLDRDQADDVEVMTPDGNVRFLTPGRYRINVYAERSELTVLAGRATFENGRRTLPVAAGQMAVLDSDGGERLEAARAYDGFDQWVAQRENATLADTARRHVSPHMTGYQDLDAYGDWRTTSDYGTVWYPRGVASDWAPYRHGRWAWVAPWGWTWIDQAPWGFAPFHYGRWALIAGRWGWVPGRIVARPVYAPALVGWVGNPGWNVSFSFGSAPAVGWFPLAPREVYVPAYRYSPTYVRQINITHVTNVTHIERVVRGAPPAYTHHASPQAVTVVPARQMQEGRPISASEIRHRERRDLDRAPLARQAPSAQWVAPAPAAMHPQGREFDAQRNPRAERRPLRDGELPSPRQAIPEGTRGDRPHTPEGMPLMDRRGREAESTAQPRHREILPPGAAPVQTGRPPAIGPAREGIGESRRDERSQPAFTQQERQPRREMREMQRQDRELRSPEGAAQPAGPRDTPRRQEAMPPSSPVYREVPAAEVRRNERSHPAFSPQEREQRREMREMSRPQETQSAPVPLRREMPAPGMRREERAQPAVQMQEREQRREAPREAPREMPRMERPPQPQPSAPPPPRVDPPRQQPTSPDGHEAPRRRDEERGQR